ncbi:MAG: PKD domain-containing protein [Candidatus Cloacimonetes bacterium]|nr:PKD domain-containing protein [Candidatus Cloacimonadota bacterium]
MSFAQTAPDTLWTRTFGGDGDEEGYYVQQTNDGGFIIVGYTDSFGAGDNDVWLIKTDINGNEIWSETYEGPYQNGSRMDVGYSVQQTIDNGYIITGFTSNNWSSPTIYLLKTTNDGTESWFQTFISLWEGRGHSVKQTYDNGYIILGDYQVSTNNRDICLVKTNQSGSETWSQTFGGPNNDYGRSVQQTNDGGYIIAGFTTNNFGNWDVYLIKTDENGNEVWYKTWGGIDSDFAKSVQQTNDDGYIIVGSTYSFGAGNEDIYLIKTNENGNEVWVKTFGSSGSDSGESVQQTNDGVYIITGHNSEMSNTGVYLIKTNEDGNEIWSNIFLCGDDWSRGNSVKQTADDGFIIAGIKSSEGNDDIWLLKVNPELSANFNANPILGYYPSLEVNFTDLSIGNITNWNWDFQNDGTYDSFEQNTTFTYTDAGIYDVKLKISSNTKIDSLIKYNYITVEYVPPAPPTNVQINISGDDAIISWAEVDTTIFGDPINVDYYIVLFSEDVIEDSLFYYLGFTPDTLYTHYGVAFFRDQMFYRVESFVGTLDELESYVERYLRKSEGKYLIER